MSEAREFKHVGQRTIRPDGYDKVTGRANFGADLSLPGMLWGKILRSPHAHAKILSIDTSKAEGHPGVMAVVTARDFPELPMETINVGEGTEDLHDLVRNILATDKALYHGHAMAAVAARSEKIAAEALSLIAVDYEVLQPVLDVQAAMAEHAPILHPDMFTQGTDEEKQEEKDKENKEKPKKPSNVATRLELKIGDLEAGFAEADVILEREFYTPTAHQGYIEPHACTARYDAQGQSMLWCSTQGHFDVRARTAKLLGMEQTSLKVVASEIGGGFGGKTTIYLEPVALLLSKKSGRPVKMVMQRSEVFIATGPTSAAELWVKVGAKKDGRITAMQGRLAYEAGAFKGSPMMPGVMTMFAPYDVPNVYVEGFDVVVNKPKVAAYRAPGAPQAEFAAEMLVSELATHLNIDPLELRLQNAAKEGTQTLYGPKLKKVGLVACLEAVKNSPHYQAPLGTPPSGKARGRALASGFWFNMGGQSSVVINMHPDGTGTIVEGSPDIGGSRASMQIMAAEALGLPLEQLRPVIADTDNIPFNTTTGGSRTTFATGMAVVEAAQHVIQQLKARAATLWNLPPDRVDYVAGVVHSTKGEEQLSVQEICQSAERTGGQIAGQANINARGAGPGFAVHLCDLEVDLDTGKVEVIRYTASQDAGRAIHPSYVEGQFQGGAVQGIGWALNEEYIFDAQGVMQNPGFLDYRIPLASDLPMIDALVVEVPNDFHPYGVRGVGETGIIPPLAAVGYAVSQAIGAPVTVLPCSPPRVLKLIQG